MTKPATLNYLRKCKQENRRFTCLTAYDASFAQVLHDNGVDLLLVGDSLGMVIQGHSSTVPVSVDDIVYHCQAVRRGAPDALLMADMPFMGDMDCASAMRNAGRILQQGGAQILKLEGGRYQAEIFQALSNKGVALCAHLGLMPQSINKLGAYKVQGKQQQAAQTLLEDAQILQQAGADLMLLECVPQDLARQVSESLQIPVIGIGAGPHCDGQVLVVQDILGLGGEYKPRFAKDYLQQGGSIAGAVRAFVDEVKDGVFPAPEHCFK
jgi:3-methyl-2-oxobutanoate hydroxymethyltransferase